jgi:hypothetical protein
MGKRLFNRGIIWSLRIRTRRAGGLALVGAAFEKRDDQDVDLDLLLGRYRERRCCIHIYKHK